MLINLNKLKDFGKLLNLKLMLKCNILKHLLKILSLVKLIQIKELYFIQHHG